MTNLNNNLHPEDLMPHSAPMVLIDRLIEARDDFVHTQIDICSNIPFFETEGVPSYVGIEYMAQTIAVWSGFHSKKQGGAPKVGFLVGTRQLNLHIPRFTEGMVLDIFGQLIFNSDDMASFDCWIDHKGKRLSDGRLNVYQPDDVSGILLNNKER